MEEYITDKVKPSLTKKAIAVIVLCSMMIISGISVTWNDLRLGEEIWATLVVMVLFAIPVFRCISVWQNSRRLCSMITRLLGTDRREISFAKAVSVTERENCAQELERYCQKGYLKNVRVDFDRKCIVMELKEEAKYRQIICPGCGAKITAEHGKPFYCEYCGTKIVVSGQEEK